MALQKVYQDNHGSFYFWLDGTRIFLSGEVLQQYLTEQTTDHIDPDQLDILMKGDHGITYYFSPDLGAEHRPVVPALSGSIINVDQKKGRWSFKEKVPLGERREPVMCNMPAPGGTGYLDDDHLHPPHRPSWFEKLCMELQLDPRSFELGLMAGAAIMAIIATVLIITIFLTH